MDHEGEPGLISDLADLDGVSLRRVDDMPESGLLTGLRRILQEVGDLTEQYQAFDNFAPDPPESEDRVR